MRRILLMRSTLAAGARVAPRRFLRGPRRPTWTWTYEVLVEAIAARFEGSELTLEDRRRRMDELGLRGVRPGRATFDPVDAGGVPAEWVRPPNARTEGVVLHLHGGGYVMGSPRSHRPPLAALASQSGFPILSVEYRLAPEHPCPAAIEDAVAAYRWLIGPGGVRPSRVVMLGDSAGGGLTLSSALCLRDAGDPLPAGLALLSPWLDLTAGSERVRQETGCDYVPKRRLEDPALQYAGGLRRDDWRVSPILGDLAGLPPLFVIAGGEELLLSDSVRIADRARDAGVDVELHVQSDEIHVYPFFLSVSPHSRDGMTRIERFIERRLAGRVEG
ncbi:MAG: alpha/beta hydrolase [Sandaracinaceae bacterium]